MIDMRFFGASELVAEVMPEGDHNLVRAVGGIGFDEWRFSRSGITYLSSYKEWSIHLGIPDAEAVFVEWFRQHSWSVILSSPGRIARQIFLALGGTGGVGILTNEGIVKLLERMSDGKTMRKQAFVGEISRIANLDRFPVQADRLLKRLTDDRVFRLSVEVQCPVCTQRSWYSLEDMAYKLQCMKCLDSFDVPSHSPDDLAWSYRSFGPFSLPGYAQGSYSVLLTHHFFSGTLHGSTTIIMSFNAESGKKKIEADFGLFFSQRAFGIPSTLLLFAECKSYGRFERCDIERMVYLGGEFPGSVLVFSTLRKELTAKEKQMLRRAVTRGRCYSVHDPNQGVLSVLVGNAIVAIGNDAGCQTTNRPASRVSGSTQGGAALPQGHQAPRMDEHGGIRNVHVIRSHQRFGPWGCEGGHDALARPGLPPALRRVEDPGPVSYLVSREGERLHHPVAIEPVFVAMAETLVLRWTVSPQHACEAGREVAAQRCHRGVEHFRPGGSKTHQLRLPGQACRKFISGSGHGSCHNHGRQAAECTQHCPA